MASIYLGILRGYSPTSNYGAFHAYFEYDSVQRISVNTVRVNNARIRCTDTGAAGYTTNTLYVNNVYVGEVNTGISGSFNGQAYENKTWTSVYSTFDVTGVAWDTTSLGISMNGGYTGNTSGQNLYGTITGVPQGATQAYITGANNFNSDQNPYFTFNNTSSQGLVAVLEFGGTNIIRDNIPNTGNYTFVLTEAERNLLYSKCPNAQTLTVRYVLVTKVGGTNTWWSWLDKTMTVVGSAPTITGSYKDVNDAVIAITGNNQLLASGISNAEITAVPVVKNYATISSVKIGGSNITAGGIPYKRTINKVTKASYLLEVTDSRGFTASVTVNLTYVEYEEITFLASFFRTAQMNNEVALQFSGTFFNTTIGRTTNTLSIKYRYQPELGEWSEWITTIPNVVGNNFSNPDIQILLAGSFDHNKQYRFEIVFEDALDTKTNTIIVRAGRHILTVTENVQVLQGKLHIQKLYTKEDKDFVFDFVYDVITRVWVVHVYGLTQLFEPQHVFQSDVNTRSIITVLNTEGYPLLKYTINDMSDNFIDYVNIDEPAHYNNYTLLDTGISPLDNVLDKRAREFQFTTFNDSAETLEFFVSAYIDSRNVSNPAQNTIDWISDPEDPNYGQSNEIEEEIANVYGETSLDSWVIDYSNFPNIGLVKSHLRLHGKGLFYRAIIVNRDMIEHELSGVTWVYRIMNAR